MCEAVGFDQHLDFRFSVTRRRDAARRARPFPATSATLALAVGLAERRLVEPPVRRQRRSRRAGDLYGIPQEVS